MLAAALTQGRSSDQHVLCASSDIHCERLESRVKVPRYGARSVERN